MSRAIDFAVIGGTGLYKLAELDGVETHTVETPYGTPSAPVRVGGFGPHRIAFMARHGEGHAMPPHRINYRANLWALRALGVRQVLAPTAVGGLRHELGPGALVIPDQLVDHASPEQSKVSLGLTPPQMADRILERFAVPTAGASRAAVPA